MPEYGDNSNQKRLDKLEEAFMLFAAIIAGEPANATEAEKSAAQARFAALMEVIRDRFLARKEA